MKTRILSGIIMLPLMAFVFIGGNVLLLGFFLIGIMGLKEFYDGFNLQGIKPSLPIGLASTFLLYCINLLKFEDMTTWYMFWVFAVVLMSLLYLFKIEERKLEDGMVTAIGVFYVVFFSYLILPVTFSENINFALTSVPKKPSKVQSAVSLAVLFFVVLLPIL